VTLGLVLLIGLSGLALGAYGLWNHQNGVGSKASLPVSTAAGDAASAGPTASATSTPSPATAGSLPDTPSQQSSVAAKPAASTTLARTTTKATTKAATAPRTTATKPATTAPAGNSSYEQQVLTLTNAQRAAAGCPALIWNGTLASVARAHSQDMAAKGYFDHNSQNGTTPAQRLTAAGYPYRQMAENIAAGQSTPDNVMTSWMGSAGHKANILNCSLKEIGVGFATGGPYGTYWTQDFGTR
jgi:uncharacterized protein YkwD